MGTRFSLRSLSVRVTDRKTSDCRQAQLRVSVAVNENFAFMTAITCTGGKWRLSDNILR